MISNRNNIWCQIPVTFRGVLTLGAILIASNFHVVVADSLVKSSNKEEQLKINMSSASVIEASLGSPAAAVRVNPPARAGFGMIPGMVDHFQIMQTGQPVLIMERGIDGNVKRMGMLTEEGGSLRFVMMQGEQNFVEYIRTEEQVRVQNEYYKAWLAKRKSEKNK